MIKIQSLPGIMIVLSILLLTACASVAEPDAIEKSVAVEQEASSENEPAATSEAVVTEVAVSEEVVLVPTVEPAPEPEIEVADWTQTAGIDGDYYILGNPAAPMRLIDFSDFMWGACRSHVLRVEPEIIANQVAAGDVNLAFHPMLDHGEASNLTHRTAECAGAQKPLAFWQMHNLLFERQSNHWRADDSIMVQLGSELGLDTDALLACINDPATQEKIARMDQSRRGAGIRLRPTFKINDEMIEGAVPYAQLQQKFTEALAE